MKPPVKKLSRGGLCVYTSAGPVQFGIPPETIKDTMNTPEGVPGVFVAVEPLFSHRRGISFCELEFPLYYNFFILRRKTHVICSRKTRARISSFLQESAFGPKEVDLISEFLGGYSNRVIPDLRKEMEFFRKNPFREGEKLQLGDYVVFHCFDVKGRVRPLGKVVIERDESQGVYKVIDDGVLLAQPSLHLEPAARKKRSAKGVRRNKKPFYPPLFGITVIGSGHGFDPSADTSGFIIWINHRGIIVDPPVDSTEWLTERNIPREHVNALVLTHCHADHDAGTLQKLFQERKIPIYTSQTIMESFIRKASAITGLTPSRIRSLVDHRPVGIGPPVRVNGAEFRFHYTLHSIPTLGFEVYFLGKSFVYSGDTLNSPSDIEKLYQLGILSRGRRDALTDFPWHHTLIFHEAGVPPLHTPVTRLAALPEDVKKRLLLVHVGKDSIPPKSGLNLAKAGLSNTIRIHVEKSPHSKAIELLNVLNGVELFREFPFNRAADFLGIARRERFGPGDVIMKEGEIGSKFYLIVSGHAAIVKDGVELSEYGPNDYFGESALVMDIPRTADVIAKSTLDTIVLEKADFLYFIRGSDVALKLRRLYINRQLGLGALLAKTEPFKDLSPTQRTHLESYMDSDFAMSGQFFIKEGDRADLAFIIAEGEARILSGRKKIVMVDRNTFLTDVDAMLYGGKYSFSAQACDNVRLFVISRKELLNFVDLNPGFYFRLTSRN